MWGGRGGRSQRTHKGLTKGFTKGLTKGLTKDSQRTHKGLTKGFTKGLTKGLKSIEKTWVLFHVRSKSMKHCHMEVFLVQAFGGGPWSAGRSCATLGGSGAARHNLGADGEAAPGAAQEGPSDQRAAKSSQGRPRGRSTSLVQASAQRDPRIAFRRPKSSHEQPRPPMRGPATHESLCFRLRPNATQEQPRPPQEPPRRGPAATQRPELPNY